MRAKSVATLALGAAIATTAPLAAVVLTAGTAQAATCRTWNDKNTFGVSCSNGATAAALCNDGKKVYGISTSNATWSYAYCAAHRGLKRGWIWGGQA